MYKKYLKSLKNTIEMIIKTKDDEVERISESETHWSRTRDNSFKPYINEKHVKTGQVYQFEFGKNYSPEMSYEHRGLVIGVNKKLLYVLPICTYDKNKKIYRKTVHYKNNPHSKSDYYFLKGAEYDFINHDSILKLNELKTVSINRIKFTHNGRMDINGDEYKFIIERVIQKHFNQFYYDNQQLKKSYDRLLSDNEELKKEVADLQEQLHKQNKD